MINGEITEFGVGKAHQSGFYFIKQGNRMILQILVHIFLAERFGTSKSIQAYHYLQQAKNNQQKIPVPENSVVFTVKLPPSLIERIRTFAGSNGVTISKVVREALEDFLAIKDHGQRKEAS